LAKAIWPRVEIVMSHAGASGAHIRALCNRNLAEGDAPVRGIVVAGTGNATVHADLEAALQHAQSQGIRIVRSTRCAWGHEAGSTLSADAPEHSQGLSAVKARIALMLELKHPS
jgi:L-asparaginase